MMQRANDALGIGIVVSNIECQPQVLSRDSGAGIRSEASEPDRHGHNVPAAIR